MKFRIYDMMNAQRHIPHWLGSASWLVACFLASLVAALWLSGCATFQVEPYWARTREPYLLLGVIDVPRERLPGLCKLTWKGRIPSACAILNTINKFGVIFVANDISPAERECVEKHDRKHVDGYDHPGEDGPDVFAIDCGDGSMWMRPMVAR